MRRVLTVITALATLLALSPAGAAQVDQTVVVHGLDYPEDESAFLALRDCSDPTAAPSEQVLLWIRYSDDEPPVGDRMHGFDLAGGNALGPVAYTPTPSTSVLTMRVKAEDGVAAGQLFALYRAPDDQDGYWFGVSPYTRNGPGWATVDGAGALFSWQWTDSSTGSSSPAGSATLPDFVATHGGDGSAEDGTGALLGMGFGCDGNRFFFDALRVGPPGDVTTYDFEGTLTAALIQASKPRITAGQGVRLLGAADPDVARFAEIELTLQAKAFGRSDFEDVGTAVATDDDGNVGWAELTQRPTVRTEYRWQIPDSSTSQGSTSPVRTVEVRTAVTAQIAATRLGKGDKLVVKGRTTPRKAGVGTTLQRYVGGRWRILDTGRTRADGTYQLAQKVTAKGRWKVRVLVAASSGNLAGTSPARTATVR